MANQDKIDRFFEAYKQHDLEGIKLVMDENVIWYFLGHHPLAGIKIGIRAVVDFFDRMGEVMSKTNPTIVKLIVSENGGYLIECIHTKTNNNYGNNLDHFACVLWTFRNGKIVEGRHFFSNQQAVDDYFSSVVK